MIVKVPITGRVIGFDPESMGIVGDPNDPVRVIPLNLGNVSWRLISIDLENDLMEIEVTPADSIFIPELDANKNFVLDQNGLQKGVMHKTTEAEKQRFLNEVKALVEGKTREELYSLAGAKPLVKAKMIAGKLI